jgi:hypothetical protein
MSKVLPERQGDGSAKALEQKRARMIYERQQRLKLGGVMSAKSISVDALMKSWPLPDGQEIEVNSSPKLWEFLASKRHPQQRALCAKLLQELEDCIAKFGFINGLCEPIQVHGTHTINWQHRTEVFRKNDPGIQVRIVFGVPISAMSIASKPWSKDQVATLALNSILNEGERISSKDRAVAVACETIVYQLPPCTSEASNDLTLRWLKEVRIARELKESTDRHEHALRVSAVRACLSLAISRYGDKAQRAYESIQSEDTSKTLKGFFLLLSKWSKRGSGEHRRYGAACLRGMTAWVSGHPYMIWKVSDLQTESSTAHLDEETRKDWRAWKKTQKKLVLPQ